MNFVEFNKEIRELEKVCWRENAFEDLQVQYCEERLYALRCKVGTPNEHICLIREQSEDAAISRAVFDLHKRGEVDNTIADLRRRLKVAEDALVICKDGMCGECQRQHPGETCVCPNGCYEMSTAKNALAVIREKGCVK